MSAEQLIALEAAQAELGALYAAARSFAALHTRAEVEFLPQITGLGSRLRRLVRTAQLTEHEIGVAAREILQLRTRWRDALDDVRASVVYRQAVAALAQDEQSTLAEIIPLVIAEVEVVRPAPTLYFPVSPSSGRRRPGSSPFLSAAECADRICRTLTDGIEPESGGTEWWDRELASIDCADSAAALEVPIALRLAAVDVRVAVFAASDQASLRIFTPRLRAPMSPVLATDATDEWWEAYQDSYHEFRDALQRELATRGHTALLTSA